MRRIKTNRTFTLEELSLFDGKSGRPAYVGYRGNVYDVTGSFHWKDGTHWAVHHAGCDLTEEMEQAPHFDDMLDKFRSIGRII
jgi:predicted heme/steroid binding protein